MKRLLLGLMIILPAMICANDTDIAQTWRKFNSYRVVTGTKSVIQAFLAGCAFKHSLANGRACLNDLDGIVREKDNRKCANFREMGNHGVVAGGMLYTSYLLACYAWKNAKHALAIN